MKEYHRPLLGILNIAPAGALFLTYMLLVYTRLYLCTISCYRYHGYYRFYIFTRSTEMRKRSRKKCNRNIILGIFFTLLLILLILRLYEIQVINANDYVQRARRQQMSKIPLQKVSGDITDRKGISFTSAGERYEIMVFPDAIGFDDGAYEVIELLTGKSKEYFKQNPADYLALPVVNQDLTLLSSIESNRYPGVICYKKTIRYDDNSLARHVVGYLRVSDGKPMSGIEKAYEAMLHPGQSSYISVFADAADRPLFNMGIEKNEPEEAWYDVQLTLDYNIQQILEEVLDNYPGKRHGGLVLDAHTGEILAMASRPQYKQYEPGAKYTDGMESSFLAIPLEQFPPGSIFKIIVAAAALESGRYTEDTQFTCTGGIQTGSKWVSCTAYTAGSDGLTMREAFAYSCNDTFVRIAMDIGGDAIIETARRFGLGTAVNIELPNPAGHLMEKDEYTGPGIANLAIGQGSLLVTPLQAADVITTILNDGKRKAIKLVSGFVDPSGSFIANTSYSKAEDRVISPATAKTLTEWMGDVTEYGTGKKARDPIIGGTAGKTGTPRVFGDPDSNEYGWFTGFFPKENPRYVIVVLSQEEGGAADTAVPLFHDIARSIWLRTDH